MFESHAQLTADGPCLLIHDIFAHGALAQLAVTGPATTGGATTIPGLEIAYWACAVAGGGLMAASLLFGGSGADTDVGGIDAGGLDADFDFDAMEGIDGDALSGDAFDLGHDGLLSFSSWFSTRFLVNFAAAFGIVGVVLSNLSDLNAWWILGWSLVSGMVVGQIAHQTFRYLLRSSGNSQTTVADYINRPGRVTVTIQPGKMGEVAVRVKGTDQYIAAVGKHPDRAFAPGDAVAVVAYASGVARVVSQREYDFVNKRS